MVASTASRGRPQSRYSRQHQEEVWGWLCASPWIIGFTLFTLGPMAFSLFTSTMNWSGIGPMKFVGLDNWLLVFKDPDTLTAFRATVLYAVFAVPLSTIFALSLALLLNQEVHGKTILRAVYFMPSVISGLATVMVFSLIFGKNSLLNGTLASLGLPSLPWLTSPGWARASVIIMGLWSVGTTMIIYLAGLKSVPQHLYEAAKIDGAGSWRCFWSVTLPMLSPTLFFTLTTGIIDSFQIFTVSYVFGTGPNQSIYFVVLRIYNAAFNWFKMGFASALAWVLFAVIMVITAIQLGLARLWVYYEASV